MDLIFAAKGMVALIVIVALLAAERWRPMAPRPKDAGPRRLASNFALAAINAGLSRVVIIPLTALATMIAIPWRPSGMEGIAFLLIDLIVLDFWIYLWHRASHQVPFLWRFHEVHHLDAFLDVTSAVRFHFGEVIMSALARAVIVIVLDIPLLSVLIFDSLVLLAAAFQHSNIALPAKVEAGLRWVIVTPSHHWVHHHKVRTDTDSNYGTVLTLWDRLGGSFSPTVRTPDMPIGTEGRSEKSLPALIVSPFKRP